MIVDHERVDPATHPCEEEPADTAPLRQVPACLRQGRSLAGPVCPRSERCCPGFRHAPRAPIFLIVQQAQPEGHEVPSLQVQGAGVVLRGRNAQPCRIRSKLELPEDSRDGIDMGRTV